MECAPGINGVGKDDCVILGKCMDQCKQQGITEGNVNSCLYMKKSTKLTVSIALYIDGNLIIGLPNAINEVVVQL